MPECRRDAGKRGPRRGLTDAEQIARHGTSLLLQADTGRQLRDLELAQFLEACSACPVPRAMDFVAGRQKLTDLRLEPLDAFLGRARALAYCCSDGDCGC